MAGSQTECGRWSRRATDGVPPYQLPPVKVASRRLREEPSSRRAPRKFHYVSILRSSATPPVTDYWSATRGDLAELLWCGGVRRSVPKPQRGIIREDRLGGPRDQIRPCGG